MITVKATLQSQGSPLFPKKHPGTQLLLGGPLPGSPMFAHTFICLNGVPWLAETAFKALRMANISRPTLHLRASGLRGLRQKNFMSRSLSKKEILSCCWMILVLCLRNITTCRRDAFLVWNSQCDCHPKIPLPMIWQQWGWGQICFLVQ